MNKLLFSFFFLLCGSSLFSQLDTLPYQLVWGKVNNSPKRSYLSKILPSANDGYLAVRHQSGGFFSDGGESIFIESYGSNHNLVKASEVDLEYSGKTRKFQELFTWKSDLYFLSSFRNRKSEINYLFMQTVDAKLTPSKKLNKIAEIEDVGDLDEGDFNFRFSRDSSKLLLFTQQPQKRKNPEAFQMKVYSPGFQEIVSHNISLTYPSEQFSVEDYQVDRSGNIYLLGIVYSDGSKAKNRGSLNYQYVVQFYPQDTAVAPSELKVQNGEFFTSDLTIRIADDGKIIGAGYYSKKGIDGIQGVTYLKIDPNERKLISQKNTPFDIEFLTELMTPKQRNRALNAARNSQDLPELSNYNLDHLILRSDGGALLIGEQYYVEQVRRFNNNGIAFGGIGGFGWNRNNMQDRIDYYYHYDDIIVVNVAPDGSIVWSTHIPKYQTTVNDYGVYSSYALSVNRDKIFLLFNDNIRNFTDNKSANYEFDGGKYSVGALAEIGKDGNSKIYVLKDTRQSDFLLKPKISRQLQRKNLTIYAETNNEYLFGRLEF